MVSQKWRKRMSHRVRNALTLSIGILMFMFGFLKFLSAHPWMVRYPDSTESFT